LVGSVLQQYRHEPDRSAGRYLARDRAVIAVWLFV
jgi:hypothetical protein